MQTEVQKNRRGFLKYSLLGLGAVTVTPSLMAAETKTVSIFGNYPKFKIGTMSQLKKDGEIDFSYPDATSTCKAVYVNGQAKAYSIICTHKGCPTMYDKQTAVFTCPCHFTKYDAAKDGQMIIGHATGGLPQVRLEIEGDNIFAIGIDGLIFGRINNTIG